MAGRRRHAGAARTRAVRGSRLPGLRRRSRDRRGGTADCSPRACPSSCSPFPARRTSASTASAPGHWRSIAESPATAARPSPRTRPARPAHVLDAAGPRRRRGRARARRTHGCARLGGRAARHGGSHEGAAGAARRAPAGAASGPRLLVADAAARHVLAARHRRGRDPGAARPASRLRSAGWPHQHRRRQRRQRRPRRRRHRAACWSGDEALPASSSSRARG